MQFCIIGKIDHGTYNHALALVTKHDLQLFDAVIVATALENNCDILYSEDMQHGQLFENQLRIVNPFQ
ncbi:PIN domain-containing protein [Deminuibacter soli]|uniref:PIN domain-containing protein n=1 Tax=Deminuibacter soli TaxID=2291815 RepID=A0A3E1NFY8_9BACT|nr:PIN domain-containing protein [Deminuibacter soli]